MWTLLIIVLISIFSGSLAVFIIRHNYAIQYLQDLCDLKQNSVEYYQQQLKFYTVLQGKLVKKLDEFIISVKRLIDLSHEAFDLTKVRRLNEIPVDEFSKLSEENYVLRDKIDALRKENKKIRFLTHMIKLDNVSLCPVWESPVAASPDPTSAFLRIIICVSWVS